MTNDEIGALCIVTRHSGFVIPFGAPGAEYFMQPVTGPAAVSLRDAMNLLANDEQGELFSH
jgi:hypothetical protein